MDTMSSSTAQRTAHTQTAMPHHALPVGWSADAAAFAIRVTEQLFELKKALSDEQSSVEARLDKARDLLDRTARWGPPPRPESGGLAPWQQRKVARYISENLDRQLQNSDLADLAGLTTAHFSRAFRSSFGRPPHRYVIERRLERAKELMLSTDAPLGQIAFECGLADQSHLSRLFLNNVGETPRTWRRYRREGGGE